MPRKILGYKTPNEIWAGKLNNVIKIKRGFAESNNIIGDVQLSA